MALWRENMQIPQGERERMEKERREKRICPVNSLYIPGTGKTMKDYVECPENRRAAGISLQDDDWN